jgi:hypothetical protein
MLLAASITGSKYAWVRVGAFVLVVLFAGYGFIIQLGRPVPEHVWCGFEELGKKVLGEYNDGPLYVFEDLAAYHLWFAFRNEPDAKIRERVVKVEGFPGMDEDKAYFLPRGMEYVSKETLPLTYSEMWLIYRAPNFDPTKPPLDTLLANGFKVERTEVFEGTESNVFAVYVRNKDHEH